MSTRLATYVDRTGKQPPTTEKLRIDSADAVKLAKFFAALGFTVEKQATPEGKQYVLAKATNVELSIFPSRAPSPAGDFSMTLMVDDAAATAARSEAAGGTIASPIKDIPGGKKCVVASFEGHRVVVAQLALKPKPAAAAPTSTTVGPTSPEKPIVAEAPATAKPIAVAKPIPTAKPIVAKKIEAAEPEPEPDFLDAAPSAASSTAVGEGEAPAFSFGGIGAQSKPSEIAKKKGPSGALVPAPEEYYEPASGGAPSAVSLEAAALLPRVQKACGISAAGILLPMFAGVIVYSTMGTSSRDIRLSQTIYGTIAIAAAVLAIVGKWFCVGKRAEFVDDGLVKSAWILDIVGFVISLSQHFVDQYSDLKVPLQIVYAVCGVVSPILFAKYLGRIAEGVREQNLMASAKRAEIGLIVAGGALMFAVATGAIIAMFEAQSLAKVSLVLLLIAAVIALVALMLYAALLAAFAANKTLKLVEGSADFDPTIPAAKPAGLSSFGGAVLTRGGSLFGGDSSGLSPAAARDLEAVRRVRTTCGITAITWAVVLLLVIYAVVTKYQPPFVQALGTIILTLAKLPCLSKTDRLGNTGLVTVAFVLDLIGLALSFAVPFAAAEKAVGLVLILGMANTVCAFASVILFTMFLSEVADELEMHNVAMFVKAARALYFVSLVFGALMVALPFILVSQGVASGAKLAVIGLIGLGVTFLLATLAYVIGTVELALNAKPLARAESPAH